MCCAYHFYSVSFLQILPLYFLFTSAMILLQTAVTHGAAAIYHIYFIFLFLSFMSHGTCSAHFFCPFGRYSKQTIPKNICKIRHSAVSRAFFYAMILIYGDSPVLPETEVTLLPNETRRNHDLAHLEDLALKSAADYFGAELLHWLGIPGKMIRSSPTEIVELETRHMYEDFLFELEDGTWCHFEFESDAITPEDLKRFREYEATTSRRVNDPGHHLCDMLLKGQPLLDHITEGINTYRVKVIRLKDHDQKKLLDSLKKSILGTRPDRYHSASSVSTYGRRRDPKRLPLTGNPHTKDNRRETYFLSE